MLRAFQRIGIKHALMAIAWIGLLSAPSSADKTLMIMVDFWGQRDQTDTIIGLSVYQPTTEIRYKGGTPPSPILTDAYETERFGWWYALPNFNADDYAQGRIRFNTKYQRGWYQNDSNYKKVAGDTAFFPDTQKTFTYQSQKTGAMVPVILPVTGPKFYVFTEAGTYRGPKLYTSAGNSETDLLNTRPTTAGVLPLGGVDKCVDSLPSDTIWIRWGTPDNPPGQQPMAKDMKCTSYNPFSTRAALVYLRNPWPGADQPVVEFNGQMVNLYPAPQSDWLVADLRYLAPNGLPTTTIRFKKSANSNVAFDSAGVEQTTVLPFHLSSITGKQFYFIPPEAGGTAISGVGAPPNPKYTLFVQNPWKPGSPRLLWESDKNYHVMRPTQSCGWYRYPLYSVPQKVLIGHSFEDSTYGTTGAQFKVRTNLIDIPAGMINAKGEIYIQTMSGTNRVPAAATLSPSLKDCSTDTLKLVMEAFDFNGYGMPGANPSFQVGGVADAAGGQSSGLVKGMVQPNLSINDLPVWTGRDSGYQMGGIKKNGGLSTPSNWFDPVALKAAIPTVAIGRTCLELPLAKGPSDSGYFKYDNQNFFPLDTISDKAASVTMNGGTDKGPHNFLFCMKGHAAFEYTPGLKFEFRGDDDVWVFINRKLAVDLGGTHAAESSYVNLDKMKLREGTVYPFDIFYCERQTTGSSILIRTTMDLQPSWKYRATAGTGTGAIKVVIEGQKSSNFVPSCADLTSGKVLPWAQTDGRMVVVGPENSNINDIYMSDVNLYSGNLTYTGGAITIDTNKLKDDPALAWPGTYQVRIESRLGDSLYTIKFTKSYGVVQVDGTVMDGNGDGVADSVRLVAPSPIFKDSPAYSLVWYTAAGVVDSVKPSATSGRRVSDSIMVMPLAGKAWGMRTSIPPGARTDSAGSVQTKPGGGKAVVNPIKLIDGMGPFADSARLSFGSTAPDTLRIWINEPSKVNPGAKLSDFFAMLGNRIAPRALAATGSFIDANTVEFILPAAHGISPADSLRIAGKISDVLGNSAANSSVWVGIRSNAQGTAALKDVNGDGRADQLSVSVRGSLSGVKSVRIVWAGVTKTWNLTAAANGSFLLDAPLGDAFPKGATDCGATGCTAQFLDALNQPIQQWALMDSVPPVVLYGSYRFGTTEDQLQIKFSEPVTSLSTSIPWIEVGPLGGRRALVQTSVTMVGSDSAVFVVPLAQGLVGGEDSASLAAGAKAGALADSRGITVGTNSAWGPIRFGVPPLKAVMKDPGGVGSATAFSLVSVRTVPASALAAVSSVTLSWGDQSVSRAIPVTSLVGTPGAWQGTFAAQPFGFGATSCDGCQGVVVGTDGSTNSILEVDSVPPVVVKGKVRYTGIPGAPDTLILNLSEPWYGALPNNGLAQAIAFVGRTGQNDTVAPMKGWTLLGPSEVLIYVDTTISARWDVGDSVRLAPAPMSRVGDGAQNLPGLVTPWAPLEFGLRPPMVQFSVIHAILPPNPGRDISKLAGIPKVGFLVVDRNNKLKSVDGKLQLSGDGFIDGGKDPVQDTAQVIMIRAKLNRPIKSGTLLIYDNLGTSVLRQELEDLSRLWPDGSKDKMREIFMTWDGRGTDKAFVASGVYLVRLVAKVDNGEGGSDLINHLWKVGFKNSPK